MRERGGVVCASRSKPTRSRIAELTRRASRQPDWEEGLRVAWLLTPFLAQVIEDGNLWDRPWGCKPNPQGFGAQRHTPMESRTPNPNPRLRKRGSLRGLAPSGTRRRVLGKDESAA